MNLKDAMTLRRSLYNRAGSMSDLARGRTTQHRYDNPPLELSENMKSELRNTTRLMHSTAEMLSGAIDEALRDISVDI